MADLSQFYKSIDEGDYHQAENLLNNLEFNENDLKNVDAIIIRKNSNLYSIFEIAKDLSDKNLEMLHSFASKLKK